MPCGPKKQPDWTAVLTALAAVRDALVSHPDTGEPASLALSMYWISQYLGRLSRVDSRITVRNQALTASVHTAISRAEPEGGWQRE